MITVQLSDNPKVIRKHINANGTVTDGSYEDAIKATGTSNNLSGTRRAKGLSGDGSELPTTPKKICLECSSEATVGDYCAFCARELKK